ncbi:MAG: NAD-dependent deacetylase [Myxococcota bacterium]|jgi:NAD-dependent deacetylase
MRTTDVDTIAGWLDAAPRVLFITGAGISVEAGLPTYRGVSGLYESAETEEGLAIEVALSGPMFRRRPAVTWRHIAAIERACRGAAPSPAHHLLARMQRRLPAAALLTQNVDGLHQAAGSATIAIHGDVHQLSCTECAWHRRVPDYASLEVPRSLGDTTVPRCPDCGAVIRPDAVLFGEMLPAEPLARLERFVEGGVDLVFSIGTTSVFPYIAAPVRHVRATGGHSVEINPGESEMSHAFDIRLRMGAGEALAAVWTAWTGEAP